MANLKGNLAIILKDFVLILKVVTKYFCGGGLTRFSTSTVFGAKSGGWSWGGFPHLKQE
jgi:hypothetical protein